VNQELREKEIPSLVQLVEEKLGAGSIMCLGDIPRREVRAISTGSIGLDRILGGGIPRGRITEVFGPDSGGKTTLALQAIANAQKEGGIAAFIDAEHAVDITYARALGVNTSELLLSQPDNGEQAMDVCQLLVTSASVDIIVVDSVAALAPRAEIEEGVDAERHGLHAALMSNSLRALSGAMWPGGTAVVLTNQVRTRIGEYASETTTGGNALKSYASVRLDIRRIAGLKDGEVNIGNRTRVKVVKNKVAPPFRQCEFDILYGSGINRMGEIMDIGLGAGMFGRLGSWYFFEDQQMGQGRSDAIVYLHTHPEVCQAVEAKILEMI